MPRVILRQNISLANKLEHFSAQWKDYSLLRTSGTFTDLVLIPGSGDQIHVHMVILLPLMPYLSPLANAETDPVILLPEVDRGTVEQVVNLLYTGVCEIARPDQEKEIVQLMTNMGLAMPRDRLSVEGLVIPRDGIKFQTRGVSVSKREGWRRGEQSHNVDETTSPPPAVVRKNMLSKIKSLSRKSGNSCCPVCGKWIKHQTEMAKHLQNHEKPRLIPCPVCNLKFRQINHLNLHKKSKHQKGSTDFKGIRNDKLSATEFKDAIKYTKQPDGKLDSTEVKGMKKYTIFNSKNSNLQDKNTNCKLESINKVHDVSKYNAMRKINGRKIRDMKGNRDNGGNLDSEVRKMSNMKGNKANDVNVADSSIKKINRRKRKLGYLKGMKDHNVNATDSVEKSIKSSKIFTMVKSRYRNGPSSSKTLLGRGGIKRIRQANCSNQDGNKNCDV